MVSTWRSSSRSGGDGAGDAGAAAVGDQDQVLVQHDPQDRGDLVLAAGGVDHGVDRTAEVAGADPEQVQQRAAEGVDQTELVVVQQVLLADDLHELRSHARIQAARRHLVVRQLRLGHRAALVEVHADLALREGGGEGGLVVEAEGDVVQTPTPHTCGA